MEVLIIDNKDSFTYNLAQILKTFRNVNLEIIEYDHIHIKNISGKDKIIISPGPGLPSDYPNYFEWLTQYEDTKSFLGICMGQEIIAEYYGAELELLDQVQHGIMKTITIDSKEQLFMLDNENIKVGLYHS